MSSEANDTISKAKSSIADALVANKVQELLDVLEELKKVNATPQLLKQADIGKVVGKLRSFSDAQVSQKAKETVKKWKQDVGLTESSASSSRRSSNSSIASAISISSFRRSSVDAANRNVQSDDIEYTSTHNAPRDKTIELMYSSIGLGSYADGNLLLKRAIDIEKQLFEMHGQSVKEEYKVRVRSLALNLKSKTNPALREGVVTGEISIATLCAMDVEDMASEESKQRDRKLAEEALFKARGAESARAETDMFRCGKCRGRKCTYFQMQTRSADEPMTTFVTCVNCVLLNHIIPMELQVFTEYH
ncbi:uncharacterized protein ATC70_002671 [Mucor velutinosus]|uniref:Transcription elongation factor S-II n=1 Tax=Mucor velutinosus TaxID=708070 RepID=A0AAN7I023_9FUNG|nr:hypothetical protein ATC70_002671 [Mucor velutinosus]